MTPYRLNLHRLVAEQIPELKLHTLITHGAAEFDWKMNVPASIHLTSFANPGDSPLAPTLHAPLAEWKKGGRLIDYLHAHNVRAAICNSYRYISFLRVIRHCHRVGIPTWVNNDSNVRSESHLSPLKAFAKRQTYGWWMKRVSGVMPMGELGDEFFLKYGGQRERFYRLPYAPDYESFAQVDVGDLERFRRQHGLQQGRKYLLFSGRLVRVKRLDLLIDAFATLAGERPDWDLLIVGGGESEYSLRQRVPNELQSRVKWTGFLEQDKLKLAYHAADVLVLPSDREPWGVVVQEAMAAGLPVVASDCVGATHELVRGTNAGRIFPVGDLKSLLEALREITAPGVLEKSKDDARASLAAWRERNDPIKQIRRALRDTGVL